jgi:hypothetical protein
MQVWGGEDELNDPSEESGNRETTPVPKKQERGPALLMGERKER